MNIPKKELIKEHEALVENLEPAVEEKNKQEDELRELKMAKGGAPGVTFMENMPQSEVAKTVHLGNPVSDQDKMNTVFKAMGMGKYAIGGTVPQPPTGPNLGMPDQNDPGFWDAIKNALGKISKPITNPLGVPLADMAQGTAEAAVPVIKEMAGPATSALNQVTGLNLPVPPPPAQAPAGDPVPLSAQTPPPQLPSAAPVKPEMPKGAPAASGPDLKNLFNQDTSKITEGVNAEDRQKLAGNLTAGQTDIGSIIAQALAGLGDAISAKGGREQHSLKDIFGLQKQQRDEALANFDKARQARLEQLDLKTKMGTNAIQQLAAQDAYGVNEALNKQLGAPAGTKQKDLPLFMQMAQAKAAQAEKDGELYMKAHKQAADEIEGAVKSASMFSIKPSAAQMQARGAKLADTYYNRAKGNILFQPSDGQPPVWIPAKNMGEAKKMDPNGQVIQ